MYLTKKAINVVVITLRVFVFFIYKSGDILVGVDIVREDMRKK